MSDNALRPTFSRRLWRNPARESSGDGCIESSSANAVLPELTIHAGLTRELEFDNRREAARLARGGLNDQ